MSEPSTESTLRRGVDLLLVLSSEEALTGDGLGVTRAAELLHLDKSLVSRTLKTLESMGVVERDQKSRQYRLGWRLYAIATRAGNQRLLDAARPVLRDLVRATGESAYLTVRDTNQVLTLLGEEAPRLVQATEKAGTYTALHCTSSGRALLMDSSPADLRAIFGSEQLEPPTPFAPGTISDLMSRIEGSRARGYASVRDELEVGLSALAAPVRSGGRIVAAINVSAPTYRLSERADRVGQQLTAAAALLEQQLGR